MNVKELQDALRVLEEAYAAGGAGKQARDIGELIAALEGHSGKSVETFADEAAALLSPRLKTAVIKEAVVEEYVARLLAVGTDRTAFDRVFGELKSDRLVKLPEVVEIAARFRNQPSGSVYSFKFGTKTEAFEFIFSTYIGRAEAEGRLGVIDQMTKWATSR